MRDRAEALQLARRWSIPGRLGVLAEDLRLGFMLGLGICFTTVLFKVAGIMATEEEYFCQMHWAFIRVLGGEFAGPLAMGLAAFGLVALPATISAWSDLRFARGLGWRPVIVPRARFVCRSSARPWRWRTGSGMVLSGVCLLAFAGAYLAGLPSYPYFDPVVLPEAEVPACDDSQPRHRMIINVLKDGRYMLQGGESSAEKLTGFLRTHATQHLDADGLSTLAVKIRADYRVPWKSVDRVLDICRELKIWRVSFGVRVKGEYW
jgi:biopolymer transport protein ExbD